MPDDPREILKAAGVECAEVEAWAEQVFTGEFSEMKTASEALSIIGPLRDVVVTSNVAILAVAQLAAKYKSAYEAERGHVLRGPTGTEWIRRDLAEEEIAKYKCLAQRWKERE